MIFLRENGDLYLQRLKDCLGRVDHDPSCHGPIDFKALHDEKMPLVYMPSPTHLWGKDNNTISNHFMYPECDMFDLRPVVDLLLDEGVCNIEQFNLERLRRRDLGAVALTGCVKTVSHGKRVARKLRENIDQTQVCFSPPDISRKNDRFTQDEWFSFQVGPLLIYLFTPGLKESLHLFPERQDEEAI